MSALQTDPTTGDLVITNNEMTFVDGPQQVRQDLASNLRTFQGEWFLDLSFGTPWRQQILKKNPENAEAALKAAIVGTPGVLALTAFSFSLDKAARKASVSFSAQSQTGPLSGEVEILIPG